MGVINLLDYVGRGSNSPLDRQLLNGWHLSRSQLQEGLREAVDRDDQATAAIYRITLRQYDELLPEDATPKPSQRPRRRWLAELINTFRSMRATEGEIIR
jgi:hypothetical protein